MTKKDKVKYEVGDNVLVKKATFPFLHKKKGKIIALLLPSRRVKFKTQMFLIQFSKDVEGCHDGRQFSRLPGQPKRCWWFHSQDLAIQV